MCTLSSIGDAWGRTAPVRYPDIFPAPNTGGVYISPSREEFDRLKAEVEQLKQLLLDAKAFDEATGQPDCEVDEKVELIKRVAELVGVDMADVFGQSEA